MRIIETRHFLAQWSDRVGEYYPKVRNLIANSIRRGDARRHRRRRLGIMVPIEYQGCNLHIFGVAEKRKFIVKTVMSEDMTCRMGWC